jgi:hypothetical protein
MKTSEVYYKAYVTSTKPVGALFYTYTDEIGIIQLGKSLWLRFDKECHDSNIESMKKVEKRKGFMFWNLSDEGEEFIQKHSKAIGVIICNMIMMQK